MSKILSLLKDKKTQTTIQPADDVFNSRLKGAEDFYKSDVQEKLASTYIINPAKADEHKLPHPVEKPKPKSLNMLPWLISMAAVILFFGNAFFSGKVNINVQIVKGEPAAVPVSAEAYVQPQKIGGLTEEGSGKEAKSILDNILTFPLIGSGATNDMLIKHMGFYGAALGQSKMVKDGMWMVNDGSAGWASVGFDLKEPLDLRDFSLAFFVKGEKGGERLEVILRDAYNDSYMPQARYRIPDGAFGDTWAYVSLPFGGFKGICDITSVVHIGLEFGTSTTGNKSGSSIQVKNLRIVRNEDNSP